MRGLGYIRPKTDTVVLESDTKLERKKIFKKIMESCVQFQLKYEFSFTFKIIVYIYIYIMRVCV